MSYVATQYFIEYAYYNHGESFSCNSGISSIRKFVTVKASTNLSVINKPRELEAIQYGSVFPAVTVLHENPQTLYQTEKSLLQ